MGLALRRIKVYGKLTLIGVIAVLVLVVVFKNSSSTVDVWFFKTYEKINVLYLILITAVASIALFWIFTRIWGVLREVRELKKERQEAERLAAQKKLADELAEREKRIDEKLRRSITAEERGS